jgi:hypothetical protein
VVRVPKEKKKEKEKKKKKKKTKKRENVGVRVCAHALFARPFLLSHNKVVLRQKRHTAFIPISCL